MATDQPFYPYREPADQQTPGLVFGRTLRVYFLGDARYEPQFGRGPTAIRAHGQTVWGGPATGPLFTQALTAAGLGALTGRGWTLTEFEQTANRLGIDDWWFVPSADQSPVDRLPVYVWVEVMWPRYAAGAGLTVGGPVVLILAGWGIRRPTRLLPAAPLD